METLLMPGEDVMWRAFSDRDAEFEGLFVAGVRTTGIFCRPTCPARKPDRANVEFFPRAGDALAAGYRPCLRCKPMEARGAVPDWLADVMHRIDTEPGRRWTAQDLRDAGVDPARARRWFQANHGMTFMAYLRARRLGEAFSRIKAGEQVQAAGLAADFESASGFAEALRRHTGAAPGGARDGRRLLVRQVSSPLGPLVIAGDEAGVHLLEFWDRRMLDVQFATLERRLGVVFFPGTNAHLDRLDAELADYFAGRLRQFTTPFCFPGSPHQEQVWRALLDIPHGQTCTYGELARRVGRPTAVRSVARAVGENRIAIALPCHRVTGADGNLTGYGGGLWRKRYLLALEERGASE